MKRTVVAHLYNEEYLLPWWLNHHRQVFHHGILIDYHSTDRSREIIQAICPTWEIRTSRNQVFDAKLVDDEIMDIERSIDGWRMCLNITEHLIGDYTILDHATDDQLLVPCLTLIDRDSSEFSYNLPLYEQYSQGTNWNQAFFMRQARSIHKTPLDYYNTVGVGRHFDRANCYDLAVLYYGWCPFNQRAIQRKISMGDNMDDTVQHGRHHITNETELSERFVKEILPWATDQRPLLDQYIQKHQETKINI